MGKQKYKKQKGVEMSLDAFNAQHGAEGMTPVVVNTPWETQKFTILGQDGFSNN